MDDRVMDLRSLPDGDIETDICIVGAGAAGITLARELAGSGRQVCLLEMGGMDADSTEPLDEIGRRYPPEQGGRAQRFGGTTHLWGGHCVPFRPTHFTARDWVPGGEWPFGMETLLPYYDRATRLFGFGAFDYDAGGAARALSAAILPLPPENFETTIGRYQPLEFGSAFGRDLSAAGNITVLLHGKASAILLDEACGTVSGLTVRSEGGRSRTLRARDYVLAAGGIENARLLLASNDRMRDGVANGNDLVGRNFMDHIIYYSGMLVPAPEWDVWRTIPHYHQKIPVENHNVTFHVAATEALERRLRIPGYRAEFIAMPRLRWAAKRLLARPGFGNGAAIRAAIADVVRHPVAAVKAVANSRSGPHCIWLVNNVEQVPNPDSRVTLSPKRDSLGEQLAAVDWRISAADKEGIVKAHAVLAADLARAGIGPLLIETPDRENLLLESASTARHHMGTTRMSADPRAGVVDPNGKAHGISNLYLAGSSVFPSGGWANPTLTIVALTIRLADHLKARAP